MSLEKNKTKFTVITNEQLNNEHTNFREKSNNAYQTNPMTEKLMKFVNNEGGRRFTVEDLLRS